MKKPPPTRRQVQQFVKSTQYRCRVDLVVEFEEPLSILQGREVARKVVDSLRAELVAFDPPTGLSRATLKCADLQRVIRVFPGPEA